MHVQFFLGPAALPILILSCHRMVLWCTGNDIYFCKLTILLNGISVLLILQMLSLSLGATNESLTVLAPLKWTCTPTLLHMFLKLSLSPLEYGTAVKILLFLLMSPWRLIILCHCCWLSRMSLSYILVPNFSLQIFGTELVSIRFYLRPKEALLVLTLQKLVWLHV